ncbi:hypothetical protein Tco_0448512 [Tanacetum coccineum]
MSSITAQQTKLDLELVSKENRLDIGKCNRRIPRGFSPREPIFQVVLDALELTPCYLAFLITADVPEICPRVQGRDFDPLPSEEDIVSFLRDLGHIGLINSLNDVIVDQMHQPWRTFATLINRSLSGKTTGLYKLCLSRAQIIWAMKESKAYKTYLGFATGAVPPKAARKFKKASLSKKDNVPIPEDEEPKGEEKVDAAHGKGIELLSDVALTEEAQMKEVCKKSLRDFHKTYPSGSSTVAEDPPSVAKITPPVTSEGTGDIPGVPDVTNDDSSKSETESWGNEEDDSNEEHVSSDEGSKEENESDKQASDSKQEEESEDDDHEENKDDDLELESNDETEGYEEKDDTTDQFDGEADARLEEPTETATGIVQGEGIDAEMTKSQQGNENLETTQEQVIEDAYVTISTVTKRAEVLVTSSSRSSDLASKFLNFSDIPNTDAEIVSPLDVPVHHEVLRTEAPTLLSIPVSVIPESSSVFTNFPQSSHTFTPTPILATPTPPPTIQTKNPLSNLPDFSFTSLVDEHLDTRLGETREEFMNFLSESFTTRIKEQVKDQLPQILPQEVSNFAPPVIEKLFHETRDEVTLAKASSQP